MSADADEGAFSFDPCFCLLHSSDGRVGRAGPLHGLAADRRILSVFRCCPQKRFYRKKYLRFRQGKSGGIVYRNRHPADHRLSDGYVAVFGYSTVDPRLDAMLSGGGAVSMVEVSLILIVSCSYGKIFQGTGMLDGVNDGMKRLSGRIGRFPAMLLIGFMSAAVFCNQTIGAIMQSNLSEGLYRKDENYEKMIDMENSVILLAGMVPWCIACSVPLAMLGADIRSILFSIYLWLVPLWWLWKSRGIPSTEPCREK